VRSSICTSVVLALLLFISCDRESAQFTEMSAEETGLVFSNVVRETQHNNILTYEYAYNGAGVAAGDLNNDGFADLYFCANSSANKLFLNRGSWKFEDITEDSNTAGREDDWKTGVTMADVNADGWLDIYVCYSGNAPGEGYNRPVIRDHPKRANQLFINSGCKPGGIPTFVERAKEFGLDAPGTFSTQAYFFDYDLDGDLDMFLLNHANMFYAAFFNTKRLRNLRHPYFGNKLFRNDYRQGSGTITFKEVSAEAGIHGSGLNFGLSASISDLNFDGYPDLYVTNDYEEQDFCYINNKNGTFREVSHKLFAHISKFSMGSDIADINNDGLQDLLVADMLPEDNERQKLLKGPDDYDKYMLAVDSGYHHQYMRNTLQLNRGFANDTLPRFSEIGQVAGISNTDWSWTPFLVDIDNDGLRDIFITNGFYRDFTNLDFMKYTADVYAKARTSQQGVDHLKIIQQLPQTKLSNYVFQNVNGIKFQDRSQEWGFTAKAVSNGSAYVDIDNDGDYDLVTNNLNEQASLLKNNADSKQRNSYVKVKLDGPPLNTQGLGSLITIETEDGNTLMSEAYFTRGYCSSVEPVMTVGLGKASKIRRISVRWPDGRTTTKQNINSGEIVSLDYDASDLTSTKSYLPQHNLVLTDVTDKSGLHFAHRENKFIDFKNQRLLYYQPSRLGGKLSVGDVNLDGNDDVFFEAPMGQEAQLYFGSDNGHFNLSMQPAIAADSLFEDTSSIFFDADSDKDLDLYVVSGGSESNITLGLYQDRLYLNDGKGNFSRAEKALPHESSSGGSVSAADFDKDGDLDLFVGGRHSPQSYGALPRSYLLQNNSTKEKTIFADITQAINSELTNPGMVTDAIWTDYNNDSWPDLIMVGEWMPITVYSNNQGKLVKKAIPSLANTHGWWTSISPADIDDDGDIDFVAGNAGENNQFKASVDTPVELVVADFNKDGVTDPILSYYIQGKSYPLATRDELLDQIGSLRKKFVKYADYSHATAVDFGDDNVLKKAYKHQATNLKSVWIENVGEDFEIHQLPEEANFSCINGSVHVDINSDGKKEIVVAGNFYPYKPQLGRSDASFGLALNFNNGFLSLYSKPSAYLGLTGDIRDIALIESKHSQYVVVSRNNDKCSIFKIENVQRKL
jgi:enediyne biosynthesis protein E4